MGQALYRKYRPKKLSEIVGQEHITTTLDNALKKGNISHAYLFTGPRGVGKTSIARILAHEVNNLPYDDENNHLDIIEIDAASNRRIDEIRELRDKVHIAPTTAKYKVYIIDEVHMLTKEAFNALLKTLEEPPEHVIFILATTEAHKVPETIQSRTQRFTFKPIQNEQAVEHLKTIAEQEKITIDEDALELIASLAEGSFRDSISLLDQISAVSNKITLKEVQASLGIAPEEVIIKLLSQVNSGQLSELVPYLAELRQQGYQASQLSRQLSHQLRQQLLGNNHRNDNLFISSLLQKLLAVPASHDPTTLLELTLLDAALSTDLGEEIIIEEPVQKPKKTIEAPVIAEESPQIDESDNIVSVEIPVNDTAEFNETVWLQVLQDIKQKHNTLYGVARMAVPEFHDNELVLYFAFPFHQKRLAEEKNRQLLSEIIKKHTGQTITITCSVDKKLAEQPVIPKPEVKPAVPSSLDNISNIFGPSEVLES